MTEDRAIKWSYMDHWRSNGPAGPIDQWHSRKTMSAFLKQIKATGFDAIDTFDFRIWQMYGDYGGPAKYQEMVQDHGLERIVNTFHAADYDVRNYAPHLPETHENIFEDFRVTMGRWSEIQLDNIIVMPATLYYDMEPVTDDKLKYTAECWNKVGEITAGFGVKLTCHHEFFCGIQSEADIDTFYGYTDPQYVNLFVDTAQHCIAGLDPVALYNRHADRVTGFHFKDTQNVATGDDHRNRPDSEIMAPTTGKWFYEMGTPDGLVDFEAMMTAVRDNGYRGWISVEHDKANKQGGDYSESTAISRWYAKNVLEEIYTVIRFAYAINQWKPQFDDFVRREQHERALKTISIAGFEGVELTAGTGRWEPLGNAQQLAANFGSLAGFREFLRECAVDTVSSWYWDPAERSMEHLTGPMSPLSADDHQAIAARAAEYAEALAELGGSVLLVRPVPGAGDVDPLDDDAIGRLAACWNAAGRATAEHGVRLALHVDFLSALRRDHVPALLERTDPAFVGLALDTGELTVGGIDPVGVIQRYGDRVWHVQFKDALAVDTDEEYLQPHAHWTVRVRGGAREVPRWFAEPGAEGGLVDFPAVTRALLDAGYEGWIVFESDQSPHPAASCLLGGYLLQRELRPLVEQQPAPA